MKQAAPKGQRGTVRAGRWLSRALLVLGGALAGTAAAWALSTTIAGAAPATAASPSSAHVSGSDRDDSDLTPVTNAAVHGVNQVTGGVSEFVGDATGAAVRGWQEVTGAAPAPRPMDPGFDRTHVKHRQHRVLGSIDETAADQVTGAVQDLANNAVVRPVDTTLGAVEHILWKPQDAPQVIGRTLSPPPGSFDLGDEIGKFFDPNKKGLLPELPSLLPGKENPVGVVPPAPAPAPPPVAPGAVLDPAALAGPFLTSPATNSNALPDTAHDAKSDREHRDESPSPFSPGQSPLVPLSFPATPGGSTVGGHFDGPLLGIPAAAATVYDYIEPSTLLAGVRHLPFEPGSQPGVTPD